MMETVTVTAPVWMSEPLYDKHGRKIYAFDLLKMYHFTGARGKRHYMYKWVVVNGGYLYGHHLGKDGSSFRLSQDLLRETEIVQGHLGVEPGQDFTDRPRGCSPHEPSGVGQKGDGG